MVCPKSWNAAAIAGEKYSAVPVIPLTMKPNAMPARVRRRRRGRDLRARCGRRGRHGASGALTG
jgi:hypothetical protein